MVKPGKLASVNLCTLPLPLNGKEYMTPLEECTVCLLWMDQKEPILSIPSFPSFPANFLKEPLYKIGLSQIGSGKGMFSTTALTRGDLITAERPIILYPTALPLSSNSSMPHPDALIAMLLEPKELHEYRRRQFLALHNCKEVTKETSLLRGICNTNSLRVGELPGPHENVTYSAVANDISRITHRCEAHLQALTAVLTVALV